MPAPPKKLVVSFSSEEERDKAFKRLLEKDYMVAAGRRVIRKVTRRKGDKTPYGIEVKRV